MITPTFLTPGNPLDKAEFTFDLKKGDEYRVAYVNGTTLGSGTALYPYTLRVYINQKGEYYPVEENIKVNITGTVDGQPLTLISKNPGGDLAVFVIEVEAGQVVQFLLDGEALNFGDSEETTYSFLESGMYKIYINKAAKVYTESYVEGIPYGVRGTFDGGDWGTTTLMSKVSEDEYEIIITASSAAEFKVVKVKEDNSSYVEQWIGQGEANFKLTAGSYKISYKLSTS